MALKAAYARSAAILYVAIKELALTVQLRKLLANSYAAPLILFVSPVATLQLFLPVMRKKPYANRGIFVTKINAFPTATPNNNQQLVSTILGAVLFLQIQKLASVKIKNLISSLSFQGTTLESCVKSRELAQQKRY